MKKGKRKGVGGGDLKDSEKKMKTVQKEKKHRLLEANLDIAAEWGYFIGGSSGS